MTRLQVQASTSGASPTFLWIPAGSFAPIVGSPVLGSASATGFGGFLFDAASTETVYAAMALPADWLTFGADMVWTNAGAAGAGNTVWRLDSGVGFGDGEAPTTGVAGTNRTIAAPAVDVAKVSTLESGLAVPSSGELMPLRLRRVGGDAGDTLGNDACVLGLRLVKAT